MFPTPDEFIQAHSEAQKLSMALEHIAREFVSLDCTENPLFEGVETAAVLVTPEDIKRGDTLATHTILFDGIAISADSDDVLSDLIHQHYDISITVTVTRKPCPDNHSEDNNNGNKE